MLLCVCVCCVVCELVTELAGVALRCAALRGATCLAVHNYAHARLLHSTMTIIMTPTTTSHHHHQEPAIRQIES